MRSNERQGKNMQESNATTAKTKGLTNKNLKSGNKCHDTKKDPGISISELYSPEDINKSKMSFSKTVISSAGKKISSITAPECLHKLKTCHIKPVTAPPKTMTKRRSLTASAKVQVKSDKAAKAETSNISCMKIQKPQASQEIKTNHEPILQSLDKDIIQGMIDFGFALTTPKHTMSASISEVAADTQAQERNQSCNARVDTKKSTAKSKHSYRKRVQKPGTSNRKGKESTHMQLKEKEQTQLKGKEQTLDETGVPPKRSILTKRRQKDLRKKAESLDVSPSIAQLLTNEGLKAKPHLNTKIVAEHYLMAHHLVIVHLIEVIEQTNDLNIFSSAVKCLYELLIASHLLDVSESFNVMDYIKRSDFINLLNTLCTIERRFLEEAQFKKLSTTLYTKLLKTIHSFCKYKKCRDQLKKVDNNTLTFLCNILEEQHSKEMVLTLMSLFKVICRKTQNCKSLNHKEFYNSLYASSELTKKLAPIIEVLKLMAKNKFAIENMSREENIIKILLDYVTSINNNILPFCRCGVAGILQTIACNTEGMQIVGRYTNYIQLYNFFLQCKTKQEHHCRMKIYSILNRLKKNTVVITINKLPLTLGLPEHVRLSYENSIENENYENFESEESSDDSDDSNDMNNRLMDIRYDPRNLGILDIAPLFNMRKYYREYFPDAIEDDARYDFRIFGNYKLHDKESIFRNIVRPSHLSGLAFPDAAMLSATSDDHIVETAECPVDYLIEKLKDKPNDTKPAFRPNVVYNLDDLLFKYDKPVIPRPHTYSHTRVRTIPKIASNSLQFESRFESGNLRKATQIDKYEYNLEVNPDTLTLRGFTWFYFQVSNMYTGVPYIFNIINFTSDKRMYNDGMRPIWFSAANFALYGTGWKRTKGRVLSFGNHYTNRSGNMQYRTLTFSVTFPFIGDYVYIAHHFPYTYSRLMVNIAPLIKSYSTDIYIRVDKLCDTVNGANEVPLLTITASPHCSESMCVPLDRRPIVILTARVHSGESNASWVMEGIINHLLNEKDPNATKARQYFIFKVIPMLNVEGVIYGNSRQGLVGRDLNRTWVDPNEASEPEIFYAKKLVEYAKKELSRPIAAFIDIHGHAQKKFFFLYGCNPKLSWKSEDRHKGDWQETLRILPKIIQRLNPHIDLNECRNEITRTKEKTARIVMWRELNIVHSYTFECSFSEGYDRQSMNPCTMTEIGKSIIDAFGMLTDNAYRSEQSLITFGLDSKNLKHLYS